MQTYVNKTYEQGVENTLNIQKMTINKVDSNEYTKIKQDLYEQVETVRFATYDNFRVARATDNYIEKYLPFKIQELVSKNMLSIIKRPFTVEQIMDGKNREMTESQMKKQKMYDEFKAIEHENYKSFHRNILQDDGVPQLKKTTFRMPGYR